ncbi:hypothetical protein [Roseibium aggregatum]|uniref:Uncharacterized protein n=1 Tax=Roseibium aggregatum TaxID=187304 RepID=A0A926S6U6_9HYPH|nr:hypothetical protein [Roseibium aggregatum]MBD1546862.1 hypothetical protein [Roseibium aggregatum]
MGRLFFEGMNFGRRLGSVLALMLPLLLLGGPAAVAQAVYQVKPAGSLEVEKSPDEITEQKAKYGTVKVIQKADGENNVLMYFAPKEGGQFTDTVTYKLSSKPNESVSATVEVRDEFGAFGSEDIYNESFKAVFILFILAVLVESGLQLIFRWRPYLRIFDTASANALIAFAFSLILVRLFHLDVVTNLFNIYTQPVDQVKNTIPGYILTALIIAGGSAGVNRLLRTFGFRPIEPPAEIVGPKQEDQAWISVTLTRDKAVGPVNVLFGEPGKLAVIGTIPGGGSMNWFLSLFLRNKARFPQSGGYAVPVGGPYEVKVEAVDAGKKPISEAWPPNSIGKRAVIDLQFTL